MATSKGPYRRSIWHADDRYQVPVGALTDDDLEAISRLVGVEAAKKRIPPIAWKDLLEISKLASEMPPVGRVTADKVCGYLKAGLRYRGAGIVTLICMLATERKGEYPPMDGKFAAGLRNQEKITGTELRLLTGKSVVQFAQVYVDKVIGAWRESRTERTAEQADNYWARGGRDEP